MATLKDVVGPEQRTGVEPRLWESGWALASIAKIAVRPRLPQIPVRRLLALFNPRPDRSFQHRQSYGAVLEYVIVELANIEVIAKMRFCQNS